MTGGKEAYHINKNILQDKGDKSELRDGFM